MKPQSTLPGSAKAQSTKVSVTTEKKLPSDSASPEACGACLGLAARVSSELWTTSL